MIEHLGERAQCDVFRNVAGDDGTLERCTRVYDHKGDHKYPSDAQAAETQPTGEPEVDETENIAAPPKARKSLPITAPPTATNVNDTVDDIVDDEEVLTDLGGRPSKYDDTIPEKLLAYFRTEIVKEIKTVTSGSNGKGGEWSKEEVRYEALFFPTLELFADSINVSVRTLEVWAGAFPSNYRDEKKRGQLRHPEFFRAYTHIKDLQLGHLVQNALIGKLNPGFAQFFAINNLGMVSKSVVENTGEVKHKYEDMTDEQLIAATKAREHRAA